MSGQLPETQTIVLDGKHYRLADGNQLGETNLNTWPPKIVTGDYSLDSNDLLSAWVISDLSGGNGVQRLKTATDSGRYSTGGLYTRFPNQITLPYAWDKDAPLDATEGYYPLGSYDLANSGTFTWYACSDTTLMADDADLSATALTAAPVSKGCDVFYGTNNEPLLFIPMGASGYATYRIATNTLTNVAGSSSTPKALWFLVWDDKLICLDTHGQLWKNTGTASTGWTSYGATAKLPKGENHWPVGLVPFVNALGDPTVHVVTRLGLWAFDAAGPKLWRTTCEFPAHLRAGNGFCLWRGDLYIACGMDVITWNGSVQRNVGLSRDTGLPFVDADGYIIDLEPSLNSVTATVFNTHTGSTVDYSVHEYSGLGWHMLWRDAGTGETPTWAVVGRDSGGIFQYLHVGLAKNGRLRQSQPVSFANPRALKSSTLQTFGYDGTPTVTNPWTLESGRFDAGLTGYHKLANAVEIFVDEYLDGYGMYVDYRLNGASSWTELGEVTAAGATTLPFGTADDDGIYPGVAFGDIELRLRYVQTTWTGATPLVEYLTLSYLKLRKSNFAWNVTIDLNHPSDGRSPEQQLSDLNDLTNAERFFAVKLDADGTARRCRLSQTDGSRNVAMDERGLVRVAILEVPVSLRSGT